MPGNEASEKPVSSAPVETSESKPSLQTKNQPAGRRPAGKIFQIAVSIVAVALFLIASWGLGNRLLKPTDASAQNAPVATAGTQTILPDLPVWEDLETTYTFGIPRLVQLHTILPTRPRFEVTQYTIEKGDTVFGIAEKFGLNPKSIMWGNREILGDNPDLITPGVKLWILPVDGIYHMWREGEGLNGVAKAYNVTPEDIIDWPANHLTRESVGDYSHPNIQPGTMLVVPGGTRAYIDVVPTISRTNPSTVKYLGPGACTNAVGGAVGTGSFTWPTSSQTLSQGYLPEINHPAIDIPEPTGSPVAAADTGVVVFSGVSTVGYGNLVVLDHGNGWQTLYAHLSQIYVTCGQGVFKGATIGAVGSTGHSTGPHLHFEMRSDKYGKPNPLDWLH